MKALISQFVKDEDGQDLIEYALLAAFIALACVIAMQQLGTGINTLFNGVKDKLTTATPSS